MSAIEAKTCSFLDALQAELKQREAEDRHPGQRIEFVSALSSFLRAQYLGGECYGVSDIVRTRFYAQILRPLREFAPDPAETARLAALLLARESAELATQNLPLYKQVRY